MVVPLRQQLRVHRRQAALRRIQRLQGQVSQVFEILNKMFQKGGAKNRRPLPFLYAYAIEPPNK